MDRTQRSMGAQSSEPAPASTTDFQLNPHPSTGARFVATASGIVDRRLWDNRLPVGTPRWNPAPEVPMAANTGTVETGPGREIRGLLARPDLTA